MFRAKLSSEQSRRTSRWHGLLICAAVTIGAAGCGLEAIDHVAFPTAEAPSAASAVPSFSLPPGLTEDDYQESVRFRESVGLRADPAWIIALAGDPTADRVIFGVPLTVAERDELLARAANADAIKEVIATYGAGQRDYAGLYTDQLNGGTVAALFTGNLTEHALAIGRLVRPGSLWEVRPARWTLVELQRFQARVAGEQGWLSDIGATYQGVGILIDENQLDLKVSSANPDAPRLIIEHFAAQDWLRVRSDGVGPWRGGYGSLEIEVVNPDGTPVTDASCDPVPDVSSAFMSGDVGYGTSEAGICNFSHVGATDYTVHVAVNRATGPVEVGSGRVTVPNDGVGRIRIVAREP